MESSRVRPEAMTGNGEIRRPRTMGFVVFFVLLAGIAWTVGMSAWPAVAKQPANDRGMGGNLITHVLQSEKGPTTVIVIDASAKTMAIYHIEESSGKIELKSVRPFKWDLQLDGYNATSPLPDEIRDMLQGQ